MEFATSSKNLKDFRQEAELFVQDVNPSFPLESISLIKKLVIAFPDLSQAVKRSLTLGNSGIEWKIDADENGKKKIQTDIDTFFKKHPGITNHLLRQILTTGALSAEIVPSLNLDSVAEIRLIPVEKVIFKKEIDANNIVRFVPYEKESSVTTGLTKNNMFMKQSREKKILRMRFLPFFPLFDGSILNSKLKTISIRL